MQPPRRTLTKVERAALRARRRDWEGVGGTPGAGGRRARGVAAAVLVVALVAGVIAWRWAGGSERRASPAPTPAVAGVADTPASTEPSTTATVAGPSWSGDPPVVCLDPGHGGADLGWVRPADGALPAMAEADYVLAQAWDLAIRLRARGLAVVLTRRTPNAVNAPGADVNGDGETAADSARAGELDELQARIDACNAAGADLLLSLHLNGTDRNPAAAGYELWYTGCRPDTGERSARFAEAVFRELGSRFAAAGHDVAGREVNDDCRVSAIEGNPDLLPHMVMTGPAVAGLVEPSAMPGAIVEPLFLSNDADAALAASEAGHDAVVAAYERAIVAYFAEAPA